LLAEGILEDQIHEKKEKSLAKFEKMKLAPGFRADI